MTRKKRQRNTQPKDQPAAAQIRHSVPGKRLVPVILVLLSLAVVLTVVRIRSARAVKEGQYRNYNVLLITLDTTRADHLPAYGYTALRAPNLDRFAGESFVFDDAFAQVPLTLPSHVSMMTGRLPISHGVRDNAGFVLNQKEITLAEILKGAGYATGAFVSAAVVESQWQLNQGFDTYDDRFQSVPDQDANPDDIQQRRAGETEARFEDWLQSHRDGKFLAWVHYYDPHDPYDPPEPYKTEYASHPYDGEIAYTDEIFGKLMATLEAWHLKDRTIIVLTADHGEGLGEHNEQVHGMFLYNTTMHVPLFIYVPGSGSRRIDGVVRHIDLAPTILDLLGMETPAEMQGVSLIGKINGTEKKSLVAYGESLFSEFHYGWSPLVSATTDDYRYIRAPRPELYDRKADPGDTRNAIQEKAPTAKVLERELGEIEDSYTSLNPSSPQKMDPETQEKLAALGYIGGGAQSTEESRKIDPKDKADVARRIQEASGLVQSQMYKQALETLAPVLQSDPDVVDAHYIAGLAYFRTGNVDAAVNELLKTVQLRPDDALALYNLGYAYDVKGRFSDAEFWYLKSLEVSTDHLSATLKLAHLYRRANEPVKAKSYFLAAASLSEKTLERETDDASRYSTHVLLGEVYFGAGDIIRAEKNYAAAAELASRNSTLSGDCFVRLGVLYHDTGRQDLESATFLQMTRSRPQDPRGYFYLAKAMLDRGSDPNEIVRLVQRGLALAPSRDMQVFGHYLLGNAYQALGRSAESRREFALAEELEKAL